MGADHARLLRKWKRGQHAYGKRRKPQRKNRVVGSYIASSFAVASDGHSGTFLGADASIHAAAIERVKPHIGIALATMEGVEIGDAVQAEDQGLAVDNDATLRTCRCISNY
jgi:hypothetical protein